MTESQHKPMPLTQRALTIAFAALAAVFFLGGIGPYGSLRAVVPDVYGYSAVGGGNASHWWNGSLNSPDLVDGVPSEWASSVFVSGSDVYVAGWESHGGKRVAKLWKNGIPEFLSDKNFYTCATSVFVKGKDVYVAGFKYQIQLYSPYASSTIAMLWKNGIPQRLGYGEGKFDSEANSVYVSGKDVYVAGWVQNKDNGSMSATLWKNGTPRTLRDGDFSTSASSVFVKGKDVYVAGSGSFYDYGKSPRSSWAAIIWKNGIPQRLFEGEEGASASSVFVSGQDVYVVGSIGELIPLSEDLIGNSNVITSSDGSKRTRMSVAMLWKNGVPQRIGREKISAQASSIFVSGSDVYVAGSESTKNFESRAMLWKNGTPQRLTDGTIHERVSSVFVSGDDVYVTGRENNSVMLWKNGFSQPLSFDGKRADTSAHTVFVSDGDVYVVGKENTKREGGDFTTIWKNGTPQSLSRSITHGTVNSIFVSGADVYAAGMAGKNIVVWKNGVPQRLGESDGYYENARSVFVDGDDVYVLGVEYLNKKFVTTLWKNGVAQRLDDGKPGVPTLSIFVSRGAVFIAGDFRDEEGRTVAALWKDGILQRLSDGKTDAEARSVFVFDGDVYAAGWSRYENGKEVATLWKNGIPQYLSDGTSSTKALSVYVSDGNVYVAGHRYDKQGKYVAMLWKNGIAQPLSHTIGCESEAKSVFVSGDDVYVAGFEKNNEEWKFNAILWKNGVPKYLDCSITAYTKQVLDSSKGIKNRWGASNRRQR